MKERSQQQRELGQEEKFKNKQQDKIQQYQEQDKNTDQRRKEDIIEQAQRQEQDTDSTPKKTSSGTEQEHKQNNETDKSNMANNKNKTNTAWAEMFNKAREKQQ